MKKIFALSAAIFLSAAAIAQTKDSIYKNFQTPPNSAMPRVWWHWMNGNITKYGIRKDLEWMHLWALAVFRILTQP
jgi:hypothetical protein